jgi:hypothetical protein
VTAFALVFLLLNSAALLVLKRRWAPLPLLVGACYMPLAQAIELGPVSLPLMRILIVVGFMRTVMKGERMVGKLNKLDRMMLIWSVWAILSCFFHEDPSGELVFRLGLVWNCCGIYFLLRVFCQSVDDLVGLFGVTAILLVPVALEMVYEVKTLKNLFSAVGAPIGPEIREGRARGQGPFAHAILAGTVGGVCLPLMIGLWRMRRKQSLIGIGACLVIIVSCASSGPIMSAMFGAIGLYIWRYRTHMRKIRWAIFLGYIGLDIVMKAPAYFLLARIDLTGGSTGWHRAELIHSALQHLNEWWFSGTDYTRHWMPTGVSWSTEHTDITNHYLHMGVMGGLLMMFLFIWVIVRGFSLVGEAVRPDHVLKPELRFLVWALGASLFAHAATCVSVSYFDQSFVFLYITLGAIGSMPGALAALPQGENKVPPEKLYREVVPLPTVSIPTVSIHP